MQSDDISSKLASKSLRFRVCNVQNRNLREAVLELKQGRTFRDYSNKNLREAYKNSVLLFLTGN